jgi:hypothetical protein
MLIASKNPRVVQPPSRRGIPSWDGAPGRGRNPGSAFYQKPFTASRAFTEPTRMRGTGP